jgi:glycosyltransferase 2 family protein
MRSSIHLRRVLGAAVSLVVVVYLVLRVDWAELALTLAGVDLALLGLAFLVYMLNYLLRTLRFRHLLVSRSVPFWQLAGVTTLHGMLNYLMPAKSGELSYPLLLRRRFGISVSEGAAGLVVSRLLDFVSVAAILPLVELLNRDEFPRALSYAVLGFSAIVALFTVAGTRMVRRRVASVPQPEKPARPFIVGLIHGSYHRLVHGIALTQRKGGSAYLILLTAGIWTTVYANFYLIVLSLGYAVGFLHIVFVSLLMVPLALLPIQGFANIGTHELGWVAALTVFGYPETLALQVAVGSHSVLVLFVVLLAGVGYLFSEASRRLPAAAGSQP